MYHAFICQTLLVLDNLIICLNHLAFASYLFPYPPPLGGVLLVGRCFSHTNQSISLHSQPPLLSDSHTLGHYTPAFDPRTTPMSRDHWSYSNQLILNRFTLPCLFLLTEATVKSLADIYPWPSILWKIHLTSHGRSVPSAWELWIRSYHFCSDHRLIYWPCYISKFSLIYYSLRLFPLLLFFLIYSFTLSQFHLCPPIIMYVTVYTLALDQIS